MYLQIPRLFDTRGHKVRRLLIITNASPGLAKQWGQFELNNLRQIRSTKYSQIIVTAVAVNKPCMVATGWQEDCSYSSAMSIVADNFNSAQYIMQVTGVPNVPNSGQGQVFVSAVWRTFYNEMLEAMTHDIEDIIENMSCEVEPSKQPPCACSARAQVNCVSQKKRAR